MARAFSTPKTYTPEERLYQSHMLQEDHFPESILYSPLALHSHLKEKKEKENNNNKKANEGRSQPKGMSPNKI